MNKKFNLVIGGFENVEQMEAFYSWYEGQGEQDASNWFECQDENQEGFMTNMSVPTQIYSTFDDGGEESENFYFEIKPG